MGTIEHRLDPSGSQHGGIPEDIFGIAERMWGKKELRAHRAALVVAPVHAPDSCELPTGDTVPW